MKLKRDSNSAKKRVALGFTKEITLALLCSVRRVEIFLTPHDIQHYHISLPCSGGCRVPLGQDPLVPLISDA